MVGRKKALNYLRKPLDFAKDIKPDLLFFLGDLFDSASFKRKQVDLENTFKILNTMTAHSRSFAVLGNYDYEVGAEFVEFVLRQSGFSVLKNSEQDYFAIDRRIRIFGLDDEIFGSPRIGELAECRTSEDPIICLAHNPAAFSRLPAHQKILMLSGHTHGGQIRVPFLPIFYNASSAPLRWSHGKIEERGNTLIVSSGLGASGLIPMRLFVKPEVIKLKIS